MIIFYDIYEIKQKKTITSISIMSTIYYTVPSDGDDFEHPNVYKIPNVSPNELTLATVAQVHSYITSHRFL